MRQAVGYIKTTLKGRGKARLHFGNCYVGSAHYPNGKVNVYLNNHLIGSAPLKTEKIIEFNFVDGNVLKIQEDNVAILEFISFEVLSCGY